MGTIQVHPESLTATAQSLASDARAVSALRGAMSSHLESASSAAAVAPLAGTLGALASAWGAGLDRLTQDLHTYAANTQLAAILYERTDQSVFQPKHSSPPPAVPPGSGSKYLA